MQQMYGRDLPKNRYGVEDEWGAITRAQQEAAARAAQQARDQQQMLKENYARELQNQKLQTQFQKEQERNARQYEFNQIQQQKQQFDQESRQKVQDEFQMKKQLAEMHLMQKQQRDEEQLRAKQLKLLEDEQRADLLRKQLESEARRKQREKETLVFQQEMGKIANQQKKLSLQQQNQEEKLEEIKLTSLAQQKYQQRDQQYRDFYSKKEQDLSLKQQLYTSIQEEQLKKQQEKEDWIRRNQVQYQERIMNKEAYDRMLRSQNIQNTRQELDTQLQLSQIQKQMAMQQKQQEAQEMQMRLQQEREFQEQLVNQKKSFQGEYQRMLQQQSLIQRDMKLNQNKMSDQERRLNGQLIEAYKQEAPTNVKVPGLISDYSSTVLKNSAQNILSQNKPISGVSYPFSQQQSPNSRMQQAPASQGFKQQASRNRSSNPQSQEEGGQINKNYSAYEANNQFYGAQENIAKPPSQANEKNYQDNLNQFYGVQDSQSRASARVNQTNYQNSQNQFQGIQENPSRTSARINATQDIPRIPRSQNNSLVTPKQQEEISLRHDPILNPIGAQKGMQNIRRSNKDIFGNL